MGSLCRCWCPNSLSCLKKLFGHETFGFMAKVFFKPSLFEWGLKNCSNAKLCFASSKCCSNAPLRGALEKLPKRKTLSFASLGCSLRQLVELPQKIVWSWNKKFHGQSVLQTLTLRVRVEKLFERETKFRKFEVLFECPPAGALEKLKSLIWKNQNT